LVTVTRSFTASPGATVCGPSMFTATHTGAGVGATVSDPVWTGFELIDEVALPVRAPTNQAASAATATEGGRNDTQWQDDLQNQEQRDGNPASEGRTMRHRQNSFRDGDRAARRAR